MGMSAELLRIKFTFQQVALINSIVAALKKKRKRERDINRGVGMLHVPGENGSGNWDEYDADTLFTL